MSTKVNIKLSVIIPSYKEVESIKKTVLDTANILERKIQGMSEIIVIDDGSMDGTNPVIKDMIESWKFKTTHLKYIPLVRNFGKESAVLAGFNEARGDIIGCIDGDGQHPPNIIPQMLAKMDSENTDLVIGVRKNQDHKKIGFMSTIFYSLTRKLGDKHTIKFGTDFRFAKRHVLDDFLTMTEHSRVNRSLMDWLGYPHSVFEFDSIDRVAGKASYSFGKLVKLAIDGIISSGKKPLLLILPLGVGLCILSATGMIIAIIDHFTNSFGLNVTSQGYSLLLIVFLFGVSFISTGILAAYIGNLFIEAQNRPHYIIHEREKTSSEDI
jgi:glucosyltransferase